MLELLAYYDIALICAIPLILITAYYLAKARTEEKKALEERIRRVEEQVAAQKKED